MYGANEVACIWCHAPNTDSDSSSKLQGLFWRDNNGSRVYFQNNPNNSNPDVYSVLIAGTKLGEYTTTWIRALHFSRMLPSYAGDYKCTANYNGIYTNGTVKVKVSGECVNG